MSRWAAADHQPFWTNYAKTTRPINTRCEMVHSSGMFRGPFKSQRCHIPASGFYKWKKVGKAKHPHFICFGPVYRSRAGLWDSWTDGGTLLKCCSITTMLNDVTRPIHDRMPVIVATEYYSTWMSARTPIERIREMLVPFPAEEMEA